MKRYFELWLITDLSFNLGFLKNEAYMYINSIGYILEKAVIIYKEYVNLWTNILYKNIPQNTNILFLKVLFKCSKIH